MTTPPQIFDVIVIGGGPAGMMAAGRASELGARVLLLEKNQRLGIKLLVTGNGRCNLTNNISNKEFIEEIWPNGKFLHSSLNSFGPCEMMDFLESRGLKLQTEEHNRVFPKSNRAMDVLEVLREYLKAGQATVMYGAEVIKLIKHDDTIKGVLLRSGQKIFGKKFILTTGGRSFPETGSTGLGFVLAKSCGHKIADLRPALASIIINERWIRDLEGVSLTGAEVTIYKSGKRCVQKQGDLIFTAEGVSGPVIHDLSGYVSLEKNADFKLSINLLSQHDHHSLDEFLRTFFHREGNKQLKNGMAQWMPAKLADKVISVSGVNGEKKLNEIKREERNSLVRSIIDFRLNIHSVSDIDRAYVTAGGVSLSEVNPKNMKSTLIDNLYFAGEILDLAGPTGGFNLQIAWSTGFCAGSN